MQRLYHWSIRYGGVFGLSVVHDPTFYWVTVHRPRSCPGRFFVICLGCSLSGCVLEFRLSCFIVVVVARIRRRRFFPFSGLCPWLLLGLGESVIFRRRRRTCGRKGVLFLVSELCGMPMGRRDDALTPEGNGDNPLTRRLLRLVGRGGRLAGARRRSVHMSVVHLLWAYVLRILSSRAFVFFFLVGCGSGTDFLDGPVRFCRPMVDERVEITNGSEALLQKRREQSCNTEEPLSARAPGALDFATVWSRGCQGSSSVHG